MVKIDKAYFGKKLKKAREERHLTINEVAIAIEKSPSIIRAYESGKAARFPSLETFCNIYNYLHISPESLLKFEEHKDDEHENDEISGSEVRTVIKASGFKLWQIAVMAKMDPTTISRRCGCSNFGQENYKKVMLAIKKLQNAELEDNNIL